MRWFEHVITAPVVLPLLFGAVLMLINERHYRLKFWMALTTVAGLLWTAIVLLIQVDSSLEVLSYQAAHWIAPFGISLVVDRLSALLLLLVALVAVACVCFSYRRWARAGVHYYSLLLFLLMGMNGALITGDLFNLFVFFEVMLAASYGLLLHGKNRTRVRAGMSFITLNLVAALFFLIGIALIYSATGSLNLADLVIKSSQLYGVDKALFEAGIAVLAIAFLAKSGIWPLGFWMPIAYSAAVPPVAALLTLVTKMGVYVIYRLWLLLMLDEGSIFVQFGNQFLFGAGMITMLYASFGLLGNSDARRILSYSAMLSSGLLIGLLGLDQPRILSAALFYWSSSALALAAFMLLLESMDRLYSPLSIARAAVLQSLDEEATETEIHGIAIPAAMAFLGLSFIGCALVLAGMPPLSGFVAKFGIMMNVLSLWSEIPVFSSAILISLLLVSGLFAIIAFMRLGVRAFWSSTVDKMPQFPLLEASPVLMLLILCVLMTALAAPVSTYMDRTSEDLFKPTLKLQGNEL